MEWLGEVPKGWNCLLFKRVSSLLYGESLSSEVRDPGEIKVYGSNGQVGEHYKANTLSPVLIIGRKGSFGKVNYNNEQVFAIDTTYFIDSRATQENLKWLFYLIQCLELDIYSEDSAIPGLSREYVYQKGIPLPPLPEQIVIAAFLDRETAKIDALIEKKERLIELLKEKRAALITQAVTKGLNPDAHMKDSGVEWLGEVPAHWKGRRNRSLFKELDFRTDSEGDELLTVSHITGVTRRSEKNVYMIEAESHIGYKKCSFGDLVINTMWGWMGALGIAWESGIVSPSYNVYRIIDNKLKPKYFDYFCRTSAFICDITRHSKGIWSSRLRIYPHEFKDIMTFLPPVSEQNEIINALDRNIILMEKLEGIIQKAIGQLQEYRTALISAAVTGKIDVREEV